MKTQTQTIGKSLDALAGIIQPTEPTMTAQDIIDALPQQAKYGVLQSLVSSLSCSVINAANNIVARLEKQDIKFYELSVQEVLHMMQEPDFRMDSLHSARRLLRVRNNFMAQFLAVANNDELDSWHGSIQLMSTPSTNSRINIDKHREVMALCEVDEETAELLVVSTLANEQARNVLNAENISARTGAIEWIIDHVLSANGYYDPSGKPATDYEAEDDIECLPHANVENLYNKLAKKVADARQRLVSDYSTNSWGVTLDDVVVCSKLIKTAQGLKAHNHDEANI